MKKSNVIDSLCVLARKLKLPDGMFDDDLREGCDEEAKMMFEDIKNSDLYSQLEFLYDHGYGAGRLEELIRKYSSGEDLSKGA